MSRKWYWLGAAVPLVVALTSYSVRADGPAVVLTEAIRFEGAPVSLDASNVTLPELARQMTQALGCEVRIEGPANGAVTVTMQEVSRAKLLAQAAATLGGRWQIVYRLSTNEATPAQEEPSGQVLCLKLPDVSCQAAAAMIARMAGGRLERDGDLTGQVSLVGEAIPVEEAMNSIAQAAKASWRRIYVMHIDALPEAPRAPGNDPAAGKKPEKPAKPKPKPVPALFSNHPSLTGKPTRMAKRDRFDVKSKTYLPGVRIAQASPEDIEKQAMLGLYGTFFMFETEENRASAMQNFQAGLAGQLKRLEALPANQRFITTMMTRRNFQRLIDDFSNLNKDQQKEAQTLYDYAKEQLSQPPLKQ
jgi:hypothetical protein